LIVSGFADNRYCWAAIRIRYNWAETGFSEHRAGIYNTNIPRHHTARSNGHLDGTDLTHRSANSTVQVSGSMPGRSNWGSRAVRRPHQAGGLARRVGVIRREDQKTLII
jgi:hypothetical protein